MQVQRVVSPVTGLESWTVLGDDSPIQPIEDYLAYLTDIERSPNTIKAYAHDLRARVTAATNKVESYNGFSKWLGFGGVLADNDPEEQEKLIKFNTLLANLVVFHNALDISDVVRQLVAEGWSITADQLGQIAPYLRAHISRFGAYATDELRHRPDPFDPLLKEVDFADVELAA